MTLLLLLLAPALAGDVFVSVDEAQALLDQGAVAIDTRGGDLFSSKPRIAGSVSLDWTELRDGPLKTGRLTDDMTRLQRELGARGVTAGTPVLVYDAGLDGWGEAGRAWWTLDYLGHDTTYILDGGLPAWTAAGKPVVRERTTPAPATFTPRPDEQARARLSEVAQALDACTTGACDTVFWDTRQPDEYAGATPYGEARGGHLPGAVGLHYKDLLDAQGRLLPDAQLRAKLAAHGITPDKQVVAYCTGGVRSGFAAAVLEHLGYPRVQNYDGSMWEWSADGSRPLSTGR